MRSMLLRFLSWRRAAENKTVPTSIENDPRERGLKMATTDENFK